MQRATQSDRDEVISHVPLPPGGAYNAIHMQNHILGAEDADASDILAYGISGFVVPVIDVDAALNLDTMWDNLIPKDVEVSSGVFDRDWETRNAISQNVGRIGILSSQ